MNATSWTVFFLFKPFTSINTTLLTARDDVADEELIRLAKEKVKAELGVDVDVMAERLGVNDNFGSGWVIVEQNDTSATEQELAVLDILNGRQ